MQNSGNLDTTSMLLCSLTVMLNYIPVAGTAVTAIAALSTIVYNLVKIYFEIKKNKGIEKNNSAEDN